jgi:DNA invertase Pin-like site-specific DNA recombinase
MTDPSKIKLTHTQRAAYVYIRQSTPGQVEHNRESTARQYALADRACQLGWPKQQVVIVDEDLGLSGSSTDKRSGFARLTSEVALTHVGIVLGLEVSRLARNNADWYRLLELCGITDTLIGDNDGVYHPALFNDRLLLGLKGTMSEAELHIIRARLDGGIRNKAARGEVRRGLPIGFVWGEQDGEVLFHPDEAVTGAIRTIFERFTEFGSARRVWLWFRSEGLSFPLQTSPAVCLARSAGSLRPTTHSIKSSPIRCMLALTRMARPSTNATSMNTAPSRNAFGIFLWISGQCSFRTIILASSIGLPFRPIRRGSTPTPGRNHTRREAQ